MNSSMNHDHYLSMKVFEITNSIENLQANIFLINLFTFKSLSLLTDGIEFESDKSPSAS
jgi:hypothetical protein